MEYKPRGNKKKITLLKQVSTAAVSPAIQALSSFTRIRIFISQGNPLHSYENCFDASFMQLPFCFLVLPVNSSVAAIWPVLLRFIELFFIDWKKFSLNFPMLFLACGKECLLLLGVLISTCIPDTYLINYKQLSFSQCKV